MAATFASAVRDRQSLAGHAYGRLKDLGDAHLVYGIVLIQCVVAAKGMRPAADQERRNARYPACGRADRETAGPRSIAWDDAPSLRWKSAPRRLKRGSEGRFERSINMIESSTNSPKTEGFLAFP